MDVKSWGDELCDILTDAVTGEGTKLDVPVARAYVQHAGPSGHPIDGSVSFPWGSALRIVPMLERTSSVSYPWSLKVAFYDYPPDADGQYAEDRWQMLYQQEFSLVGEQELSSSREVVPRVLRELLAQLFAAR